MWIVNLSLHRDMLWVCEFSSYCGSSHQEWNLWQDYVLASPIHFQVTLFSFLWCEGVAQIVFRFFSTRSCFVWVWCLPRKKWVLALPTLLSWTTSKNFFLNKSCWWFEQSKCYFDQIFLTVLETDISGKISGSKSMILLLASLVSPK